eukprot:TRINITY_DN1917_c0_g1_i7.p2 TRINITY_DN1917_c0_g1~~TRINITY_DN1917_c0_g1_i7.p2  ORF type:complete len:261 (-),score=-8.21 TRINITY_DN1917_c0_g1_i7:396-1178(-)
MSVYCVFSFYVFIFSHLQTNIANDVSLVNFNVLIILPKQTSMSILFYKRFWQFLVVFNSKRCRETSYGQIIIFNILVFKSFFGLRNVILYLSEISANIYIFYIFRLFIHIFRGLKIYIFCIFKIICRYFRNLQIIVGQTRFFEKFAVLTEGIDLFQIITFIFVDIIVVFSKEVRKKDETYIYQYTRCHQTTTRLILLQRVFFPFVGICLTKSKVQQIGFIAIFQLFELSIIYPQKNIKQINKGFLQPPSLQKLVEALCLS